MSGSGGFIGPKKNSSVTTESGKWTIRERFMQNTKTGLTALDAAPSAVYLRDVLGITTSGDYWIKPAGYSGAAVRLWCDMTSLGGGWVLIGKGRQSSDNSSGWFGTENELSISELQSIYAFNAGISKVSSSFVNYLMNGTANGWQNGNANNYLVANRINNAFDGYLGIGDSATIKVTNETAFKWVNQIGTTPTDSGTNSGTRNMTAYTSMWAGGSARAGAISGASFRDNDFGSGNGTGRWFTWHWSGHGAFHGWSSGSTETRGFVNGAEAHAIQFVHLWAR
jgi:hypothetical protein